MRNDPGNKCVYILWFSLPIFDILIKIVVLLLLLSRLSLRSSRTPMPVCGIVLFRFCFVLFFHYACGNWKQATDVTCFFSSSFTFTMRVWNIIMSSKHFAMWICEFWNINIVAIFAINYTCMCYFFSPFKIMWNKRSQIVYFCAFFLSFVGTLVAFYWECSLSKFRLFRIQSIFNGLIKINWIYLLSQAKKTTTTTSQKLWTRVPTLFSVLLTLLFCAS